MSVCNLLKSIFILLLVASCKTDILIEFAQDSKNGSGATSNSSTAPPGSPSTSKWIEVPANAGGMGLPAFKVMKYEAKAWIDTNANSDIDAGEVVADGTTGPDKNTHVPVSVADNKPWGNISADDAASECESLGAKYHLISNEEWMAIARDAESQNQNWTGGTVGSGCLRRGNTFETVVGDGTNLGDSCGYKAAQVDAGETRDIRAGHVLSNSQVIYDLAGNLYEWTDWDKDTAGFQLGPTTCAGGWAELNVVACGALVDADYNSSNGGYTATEGVGRFQGGTGGAAARGARYSDMDYAGIYTILLFRNSSYLDPGYGFRCVYRP